MLIDCESCAARPRACADCVVTVLLGMPGQEPNLEDAEQTAIAALAAGGLVPPLRLVPVKHVTGKVEEGATRFPKEIIGDGRTATA